MNWLAHVFLSENHIEHQLGNLLADPLKGKAWDGASPLFQKGLETHLYIDTFTDKHALVKESKARFKNRKYLRGVVVDIVYDHLLTKHWDLFATHDFEAFTAQFRQDAPLQIETYPERAKHVINNVVNIKLLSSYADLEGLGKGLKRIDKRLSERVRAKETAFEYLPLIRENLPSLENDFLQFFPELMEHIRKKLDNKNLNHWV
jgi:acyl carrier protein phosphodiesterase